VKNIMPRILILEDEIEMVHVLADILEEHGYETTYATQRQDALRKLEEFKPDLVTLDLKYGDGGEWLGLEILREIRSRYDVRRLPVIVISGTGDALQITELLKLGMNDYVFKPIIEPNTLVDKVRHFLSLTAAESQAPLPERPVVVGKSRPILELIIRIQNLASQELNVLFEGETGTGKSYFAELYHQFSPRSSQAFFTVDVTTLPDTLFESEVFGYDKGAHNKADRVRKGKAEEAEGGTLFLDEIGELGFEQQAKLLTLIRKRTITRLGSNTPIKLNIVILAATNRDLPAMVKAGTFREDLYHTLGMRIHMPALREHAEDIPELVRHLIQRYQPINPLVKGIDSQTLERLATRHWEGNIRQLENCIRFAMTNCRKEMLDWKNIVGFFDVSFNVNSDQDDIYAKDYDELKQHIRRMGDEIETRYLLHHLESNHYNVPRTAEAIRITHRQQLNLRLRQLKIREHF
jgi:DNA-binding NtrC family response regulator